MKEATVNKESLAAAVAKEQGLSQAEAERLVTAVFAHIQNELAGGGSVTIKGFGTFSVAQRAARTGRNMLTQEQVAIAPRLAPKFEAGKLLKAAISGGAEHKN
jgi:DNA-binding protein HU-beta